MKWILIAAMAEMVTQGITPSARGRFMQQLDLPATDIHSPTMIAQYETREECEKYASNILLGQSILLRKIRTYPGLERLIGSFVTEDEAKEYLGKNEEQTPIYGKHPMFVAAQCVQISGPIE